MDLVLEAGQRLLPIEIKAGKRVGFADTRGIASLREDYADMAPSGVVLYGGNVVLPVSDRVPAIPAVCLV